MRGSRLPLKIPARRKAAATRLQSAWRARPARREFLAARAAAIKVQRAFLRWSYRDVLGDDVSIQSRRPPSLTLGMSSAARKQACRAAISGNIAALEIDRIGICVKCSAPSVLEQMTFIDDQYTQMYAVGEYGFTAEGPHCRVDAVLPFRALPRDPVERRVLLRWCHNDRFLAGQTPWMTTHLEERMRDRNIPAEQVNWAAAELARLAHWGLTANPDGIPRTRGLTGPGSSRHWCARRELQRAGRYVLFAKRLERAYFEAMDRRYAPGSVGEAEAMLSFRDAVYRPRAVL